MSSIKTLNSKAEVLSKGAALFMNINAAKGLYDVMKTNLGPKGTIKMLVGGAGGVFRLRCTSPGCAPPMDTPPSLLGGGGGSCKCADCL